MSFSRKINICIKFWIYLSAKVSLFTENKYLQKNLNTHRYLPKFLFSRNYLVTFYILTGIGWNPPMDEMKTIDPLPWFCIWGTTDLANKNEAFTLTSNILSHASSLHWKKLIYDTLFPANNVNMRNITFKMSPRALVQFNLYINNTISI